MHDTVKKHIQTYYFNLRFLIKIVRTLTELLHTSLVSITVFKPYLKKKVLFRKCNHNSTFTSNKMYLVNSYNIKFYLC